jgi:hypothetical protein
MSQDEASQEPDLDRWISQHGYKVGPTYRVHGLSAFHGKTDRPCLWSRPPRGTRRSGPGGTPEARRSTGSRRAGSDQEDDPGHREREADDRHREEELVPPRGVVDQTPPVVRPVIMTSATWIVRPCNAVRTAANSHDRHEYHGQDADDRQRRTITRGRILSPPHGCNPAASLRADPFLRAVIALGRSRTWDQAGGTEG